MVLERMEEGGVVASAGGRGFAALGVGRVADCGRIRPQSGVVLSEPSSPEGWR